MFTVNFGLKIDGLVCGSRRRSVRRYHRRKTVFNSWSWSECRRESQTDVPEVCFL